MKMIEYLTDGYTTYCNVMRHPLNKGLSKKLSATKRFFSWYLINLFHDGALVTPFVNDNELILKRKVAARDIYFNRLHEFEEMCFVAHALSDKDLFIDVGANIGAFSVMASGVTGARSIAFEPAPISFSYLQKNIMINNLTSKVELLSKAVGDQSGHVVLEGCQGTGNSISVDDSVNSSQPRVELITLDSLDCTSSDSIFLKIDVEGYEEKVIEGAKKLVSSENIIGLLIEMKGHGKRYGADEGRLFNFLIELGFHNCRYDPITRQLHQQAKPDFTLENQLFIRDLDAIQKRITQSPKMKVLDSEI